MFILNHIGKFILTILTLLVLFTLERLYLLPIYIPLDTQPKGIRTAIYLGKTICKKADFDYGASAMEVEEYNRTYNYSCDIDRATFSINIFMDKSKKNIMLEKIKKSKDNYSNCFKHGAYYIICEMGSLGRDKYGTPSFGDKEYYNNFPGETIEYRE